VLTRKAASDALEAQGVTGHALECVLRETSRERHLSRVAAASEAAAAYWAADQNENDPQLIALGAACILWLDVAGIGGKDGIGGDSTRRHYALAFCGKGRKQAADGDAWSAAIFEAARTVKGEFGVIGEDLAFFSREDHGRYVVLTGGSPWEYTVIRLGLSRAIDGACNSPGAEWYDRKAWQYVPYDQTVTTGQWAAALNAHIARVEAMAAVSEAEEAEEAE
jgi:hypothetical protein